MQSFLRLMDDMAFHTSAFPNERGAYVEFCNISRELKYMRGGDARWTSLSCGMDSRVYVADWLEKNNPSGSYYHTIGSGAVIAAANAIASKLALPVAYGGGTVAGDGA